MGMGQYVFYASLSTYLLVREKFVDAIKFLRDGKGQGGHVTVVALT